MIWDGPGPPGLQEPDQPVKFPVVHAGDNQIDCQYCHTTGYSKSADPDEYLLNRYSIVRGTYSGRHQIGKW
jgi:hypothetical protein